MDFANILTRGLKLGSDIELENALMQVGGTGV
jgi:hypothetical protein